MIIKPTRISEILIPPTGRGIAVGMTGSGKTTLSEFLCSRFQYVSAIDPKGTLNWQGYKRFTSLKRAIKANEPRFIYSPAAEELRDERYTEAFFRYCYLKRNNFVYVDEVYAVASPSDMPPHYHAILTRGRERGTGLLSATQRPMQIPNVIMSESENWYVFRLSMPNDRKKVRETIGITEEEIGALEKRQFYFALADRDVRSQKLILDLKSKAA